MSDRQSQHNPPAGTSASPDLAAVRLAVLGAHVGEDLRSLSAAHALHGLYGDAWRDHAPSLYLRMRNHHPVTGCPLARMRSGDWRPSSKHPNLDDPVFVADVCEPVR
jgi:hypothetical protein